MMTNLPGVTLTELPVLITQFFSRDVCTEDISEMFKYKSLPSGFQLDVWGPHFQETKTSLEI